MEQGRAEAWMTEFLAEIQQQKVIERRQEVEDLLIVGHPVRPVQRNNTLSYLKGAIARGASVRFGSPRVRNAIVGVVSPFVVRKARGDANHS